MNDDFFLLLTALAIAAGAVSFFVAKIVGHYALKMGIYTLTDGSKIAMWGGIAFVAPMLIIAPLVMGADTGQSIIILLAILSLALFGLLDDIVGFSPFPQLAMQIFVAASIALSFVQLRHDTISFLSIGGMAIIAIAMINSMNAFNWVDGVDGLAASVGITGLLILGLFFWLAGNGLYALYSFVFASSLAGFLFLNYSPARLYMGTAGSMGMGLLIALAPAIRWELTPLFLCAFALPLGDWFSVIAQRILAARLPWQGGDRRHLHYRLVDMGWGAKKIVLLYVGGTAVFALLGIISSLYGLGFVSAGAVLVTVCIMPILLNFTHSEIKNSIQNTEYTVQDAE
ncbi:MAG: undecaprenyl/decaprenyl-phosphate alpha-N-acetylglucosaminyl 1-phosphate transferase [Candidatus Spechtbacteria bacterium]|nr:undecaprenyl/decaprenyl-phosphate alpha-N-acetylglucosaminyl 1-phosphate transferase [Candidatus Spechtbacteria bacterium]